MLKLKRLLVPVDFSDSSRHAALYAQALARHFGGEVRLLHVVPPFEFAFAMAEMPGFKDRYTEARHRSLWTTLAQFPETSPNDVPLFRQLREGDAAEEIVDSAHEGGFDAIVMPTRRATPLRQVLLMGSVTSKVLAAVRCPVFTGFPHGFAGNVLEVQNIVCGIDLGPTTGHVLCWASELAAAFRASLTVVHAAPGPGEATADYLDDSWRTTLVPRLRQHIEEMLRQTRNDAQITVEAGQVSRVVISVAQRAECNLLVIGRGTSGDLLGRLRANAWDLIRQSPCPVLSV